MEREQTHRVLQRPCKHLRCKEMYYMDNPFADMDFSSESYWCDCTQEALGPDNKPAGRKACGPGRGCYAR